MPSSLPAPQVLEREFLEIRCKILDLAASLDRLDRGDGEVAADPRMQKVLGGIRLLLSESGTRAEELQLLFSRPYDEHWKEQLGVAKG
ncbi:MAG: hypothetical protein IT428_15950 [Planctomycetaceae bacterium]|nr:hypothetical protein [Planctomycetaceae bacterium]